MKKKKSAANTEAQKPSETIDAALEIIFETFAPKEGYILCLKSLPANLQAYEGFQWPEIGHVKAPDWRPTESCGNGLHAFRWGAGDVDLACSDDDAKWLVLQVKEEGIIDLDGKVKFEECEVVFCGAREVAISIIQKHAPAGTPVMYGTATAGDSGTATAGYKGTATAGNSGTATAGNYGTATAGDSGTATAGNSGTATAGNSGTATAGNYGTATAGYKGTATAGDSGTATAGDSGTATAGNWGVLIIEYWNKETDEYRKKIALVDGVNYLPGVKYRLNSEYEFEQINETEA